MNTQKKIQHSLNDLIEIARDGHDFYTEAAGKVKDAELSALFMRIAGVKQDIVTRLSTVVASAGGKPAEHGTMVGSMQQFYGKVRAALGDTTYGYVAELEESEDRLLKAFNETIGDEDTPAAARAEAQALLPSVRECHNVMRGHVGPPAGRHLTLFRIDGNDRPLRSAQCHHLFEEQWILTGHCPEDQLCGARVESTAHGVDGAEAAAVLDALRTQSRHVPEDRQMVR